METEHRITPAILKRVLASDLSLRDGDDVEVLGFDVSGGAGDGDNLICEIKAIAVSARISGKREVSKRYMAKCVPISEFREAGLRQVKGRIFMSFNPCGTFVVI